MTAATVGPGFSTEYLDGLLGKYVDVHTGPDSLIGGRLISYADGGILLETQSWSMRLGDPEGFTPDPPKRETIGWAPITTIRKRR